jgi:hypothetical protein
MAKNRKKPAKKTKYRNLLEQCSEMNDLISSLLEDKDHTETDVHYLWGFLSYKKLEEEYLYFRENAHEEYEEDMPFPHLTL